MELHSKLLLLELNFYGYSCCFDAEAGYGLLRNSGLLVRLKLEFLEMLNSLGGAMLIS